MPEIRWRLRAENGRLVLRRLGLDPRLVALGRRVAGESRLVDPVAVERVAAILVGAERRLRGEGDGHPVRVEARGSLARTDDHRLKAGGN